MVDCSFPYHNPALEGTHDPRPTEMCQMSLCYVLLTSFHKLLSDGPPGRKSTSSFQRAISSPHPYLSCPTLAFLCLLLPESRATGLGREHE